MTTFRRPHSNGALANSPTEGGTAVFRAGAAPGAATATLPAAGVTPPTDVWEEVFHPGASSPSYVLVASGKNPMGTGVATFAVDAR